MSLAPLVCPGCGTGGEADERFCPRCGSPFVHAPGAHELVRVARARNQPEAELQQNLLRDAGVPSLERRSGGFDVPDFLAAGPRDILVARGDEARARDVLGTQAAAPPRPPPPRAPAPAWVRVVAAVLALCVCGLVVVGVVAAVLA